MERNCSIEVRYNHRTCKWEVRRDRSRLPAGAHVSRDQAIMFAFSFVQESRPEQITIFDEGGKAARIIKVEIQRTEPGRRASPSWRRGVTTHA